MNSAVGIFFIILLVIYIAFAIVLLSVIIAQKRKGLLYLFFSFFFSAIISIGPALHLFHANIEWTTYFIGPIRVSLIPLTYLYLKKLSEKNKSLNRNDFLHFVPMFISVVLALILVPGHASEIVSHSSDTLKSSVKMIWENHPRRNILAITSRVFCFLQAIFYPILVYKIYRKYMAAIKNNSSLIESFNAVWIKWVVVIIVLGGFFEGFGLLGIYNYSLILILTYVYLVFYAFFFFIHALMQKDLSSIFSFDNENITDTHFKAKNVSDVRHYTKKHELVNKLKDKELYLNPEISLQELAEKLDVSKHRLSKIIKDEGFDNFFVFINHFRIQKSISLLSEIPENKVIDSVVTESGFKSRATFYRVFKESTGLTPKDFVKRKNIKK